MEDGKLQSSNRPAPTILCALHIHCTHDSGHSQCSNIPEWARVSEAAFWHGGNGSRLKHALHTAFAQAMMAGVSG